MSEPLPSVDDYAPPLIIKLLLIGDSSVGKTSLMRRYCDGVFMSNSMHTLGIDFKIKNLGERDGRRVKLQIWDTAGQERFHTITTSYYRGAKGILLVYDVSRKQTFENVARWMRNISEHASEDVQTVLIGNKCDKADGREVHQQTGAQLARENSIGFMETSAKADVNVSKAFESLTNNILFYMSQDRPSLGDELAQQGVKLGQPIDNDNEKRKCCSSQ